VEVSDDARKIIEKRINKILKKIEIPEASKNEIKLELISTYTEAAIAKARLRGAVNVEPVDVLAAIEDSEDPEETAAMYMASYVSTLRRAGFWWRLAAYLIDDFVLWVLFFIVTVPTLAYLFVLRMPFSNSAGYQPWFSSLISADIVILVWLGLASLLSDLIILFGYYLFMEGHFGYTVGKYLLGLRVLRTNGTKIGYREAILRNIPKYLSFLIIVDVLIMLIFFNREKQRGFDRIANTMVVHIRKA
jgi:uncharacterized RDD family membrane protein YckC